MQIRTLTSSCLATLLALGLVACGDDKDPVTTTQSSQTGNATNTTNTTNTTNGTGTTDTGTDTDGTGTGTDTDATSTPGTSEPTTTTATATSTTEPGTTTEPMTSSSTTLPGTSTTEPGTSTTGGPSDGEYGPCGAMGECPANSDCVSLEGIDGNFCSPKCDGMMCPAADGVAQTQCVLVLEMGMDPTNCAALCDPAMPDSGCVAGTTCKQVPMQMVGICTAP